MTQDHLLLVALGPVQEFIGQARRTRDLWYSSHVLSELSRAAARELAEQGATLIIPALDHGSPELEPGSSFAIANKIYVVVPPGRDPAKVALATREHVRSTFRDQAAHVFARVEHLLARDIRDAWNEQVDSLLEFTAGWMPLGDAEFGKIRAKLDATVAARKQLREFEPWRAQRGNVPKSSLDGARDTVLPPGKRERKRELGSKHGVGEEEQLDAIGVIKRAGGDPERFTPIINVALSSWLRSVDRDALERCSELCSRHRNLVQHFRHPLPCTEQFPHEASVLLPSRWDSLQREKGIEVPTELQDAVLALHGRGPAPDPYVACLVADGDRMGHVIENIGSASILRQFSARLSEFAQRARVIVEQHHFGSLVYAGGDDVLAFLPVDQALACADALREEFTTIVGTACTEAGLAEPPTLSVGVGIGHYMESMGELLAFGRDAERLAKQTRNTLAVLVDKRSGGRRQWAASWADGPTPTSRIRQSIELFEKGLSTRKIHEIAATLERLPEDDHEGLDELLANEVKRSLARNQLGVDGDTRLLPVGLQFGTHDDYSTRRKAVREWIDRLLIAREFAKEDTAT